MKKKMKKTVLILAGLFLVLVMTISAATAFVVSNLTVTTTTKTTTCLEDTNDCISDIKTSTKKMFQ